MNEPSLHGYLLTDFNSQNFTGYINNDREQPVVRMTSGAFGQVSSMLVRRDADIWKQKYDVVVVWTQPASIIASFARLSRFETVSLDQILSEVDAFVDQLLNLRDQAGTVLVPAWVFPSNHRVFGLLDMKKELGIANTLMQMNLRLVDGLSQTSNFFVMNTQKWLEAVGPQAFNAKLWYMAKVPFGNKVFQEAAKDVKAALRGIQGLARKLIVVDLDDTLWGGIVGDIGWEALKLGGHDHGGEAYVDFQRSLKNMTQKGILLGIVSKNEEATALEAINSHPEMVLRVQDFVGWRINWSDKAQNIVELTQDLNLGLQSVVFIDDNPVERSRVRDALPEVLVPEWPTDSMMYKSALLSLSCFDTPAISVEDKIKTDLYISEGKRKQLKNTVGSLEDWLKSLEIQVQVESLSPANLPRTTQLFNKTNQMNLTTRRLTESDLESWVASPDHILWTFRVKDKFGEAGLTGIASLVVAGQAGDSGQMLDFVLSCRVMGRKIEETMLYTVLTYGQSIGLREVYAEYIPTKKNKPCLDFFQNAAPPFKQTDHTFSWDLNKPYPLPECIALKHDE